MTGSQARGTGRRKLTTIFCADVAGYAAQVAADEEGAIERLHACRRTMTDLFERYDGREINSWGDAVIAEFASPVEAVRCAVDLQDALDGSSDAMRLRIGINLGDVVERDGDVYGEGVNRAARLEAIAPAGGIAVSDTVHSLVERRLAYTFDRLEERHVKAGEEPVGGYVLRTDRRNTPEMLQETLPETPPDTFDTPPEPAAPQPVVRSEIAGDAPLRWLMRQPRVVRVSAAMIVFVFLINAIFTGLSTPWFIFPSMAFVIAILMFMRGPEGAPSDERDRE